MSAQPGIGARERIAIAVFQVAAPSHVMAWDECDQERYLCIADAALRALAAAGTKSAKCGICGAAILDGEHIGSCEGGVALAESAAPPAIPTDNEVAASNRCAQVAQESVRERTDSFSDLVRRDVEKVRGFQERRNAAIAAGTSVPAAPAMMDDRILAIVRDAFPYASPGDWMKAVHALSSASAPAPAAPAMPWTVRAIHDRAKLIYPEEADAIRRVLFRKGALWALESFAPAPAVEATPDAGK